MKHTDPQVDRINAALHGLYAPVWEAVVTELPTDRGLSCPLFLKVQTCYTDSPRRLMIVGQQTQLWPPRSQYGAPLGADPIARLMDEYVRFDFGADRRGAPFWRAAHLFRAASNNGAPRAALLWSNLIKLDECGRKPSPPFEAFINRYELLLEEVRLCRPDVVLFCSGKGYDDRIRAMFKGALVEPLSAYVATVRHPELPAATYRIPHPNWLQRTKRWNVIDSLVSEMGAS